MNISGKQEEIRLKLFYKMKKLFIFLLIGILLLNIFLLIHFVYALTVVPQEKYYEDLIKDPQAYVRAISPTISVENGAKIVSVDSNDPGLVSILGPAYDEADNELLGGNERVLVDLKELPKGSKILKDGSILINEGKPNELKISEGEITKKDDGSLDIRGAIIEINGKRYSKSLDSLESLNVKVLDDKITLTSRDITGQYDSINGAIGSAHFNFAGSISVYSDGHIDIEKGTYFSKYRNLGNADREIWHIGKEIEINGIKTYTGTAEKIAFSDNLDWAIPMKQAYIKTYLRNGEEMLFIGNVNFKLDISLYNEFLEGIKTNVFTDPLKNGKINFYIEGSNGNLFVDSNGVNTQGDVAGINLNSKFIGEDGKTHDFILSEDGSVKICSDPCRECGQAKELLRNEAFKNPGEKDYSFRIRLGDNTLLKEAVKISDENSRIYKAYDLKTGKEEIYYSSEGGKMYTKDGSEWKLITKEEGKPYEFISIKGIASQKEIAVMQGLDKGNYPSGSVSITPAVDTKMIGKLSGKANLAGDIVVQGKFETSIGGTNIPTSNTQTFKLNPSSGKFETEGGMLRMTPEQFNNYLKDPNIKYEVVPYTYKFEGPSAKSAPTTIIRDSTGKIVGAIRSDAFENGGTSRLVIKNNGYFTDSTEADSSKDVRILGTYKYSGNDAKKAFEGRALYQWYLRPSSFTNPTGMEFMNPNADLVK